MRVSLSNIVSSLFGPCPGVCQSTGGGGGGGCSCGWALCPSEGQCERRLPHQGEGGGGPAGPGAAVLPLGGSQGLERGHGRASEEGT